jgi:hypothetical protein
MDTLHLKYCASCHNFVLFCQILSGIKRIEIICSKAALF